MFDVAKWEANEWHKGKAKLLLDHLIYCHVKSLFNSQLTDLPASTFLTADF